MGLINLLFLKNKVELTLIGKEKSIEGLQKERGDQSNCDIQIAKNFKNQFWEGPIWDTILIV